MLKKSKIIKIIGISLLAVIMVVCLRVFLFEGYKVRVYEKEFSKIERYEDYLLLNHCRKATELENAETYSTRYVFMFQWNYDKIIDAMERDLEEMLKEAESYEFISRVTFIEEALEINIYYKSEEEYGRNPVQIAEFEELVQRIQYHCDLMCSFGVHEDYYEMQRTEVHVWDLS